MSLIRAALIVVSLCFLVVIVRLVRKKHLTLKYSFLWLGLGIAILICALLPVIPYRLSDLLGFEAPSNFIFLVATFFLLAIALSLSIVVSKQQRRIVTLVQELALMKSEEGRAEHEGEQ